MLSATSTSLTSTILLFRSDLHSSLFGGGGSSGAAPTNKPAPYDPYGASSTFVPYSDIASRSLPSTTSAVTGVPSVVLPQPLGPGAGAPISGAAQCRAEGGVRPVHRPVDEDRCPRVHGAGARVRGCRKSTLPRVGSGLKTDFVKPIRDAAGNIVEVDPIPYLPDHSGHHRPFNLREPSGYGRDDHQRRRREVPVVTVCGRL